jgi:NAD(P)-dependent dehydrogenase (short-subunit alcohol dehydrogenase family)
MTKRIFKPKKLSEQTIVVTGGTQGLGLALVREALSRGARVVVVNADGAGLAAAVATLPPTGAILPVVADVTSVRDLDRLVTAVRSRFGGIDTWINQDSVALAGYLQEGDEEQERQLFEINFWGTRSASKVAVSAMREEGGVLINLGSEITVAAEPLLGMYGASKDAVKAFTDALRLELRDEDVPVEVCLVRPTAIAAPLIDHEAADPGPGGPPSRALYGDAVRAILRCAEAPRRDVYVGGPARLSAILDTFFPSVRDLMAEGRMRDLRRPAVPDGERENDDELSTSRVLRTLRESFRLSKGEGRRERGPENP